LVDIYNLALTIQLCCSLLDRCYASGDCKSLQRQCTKQ